MLRGRRRLILNRNLRIRILVILERAKAHGVVAGIHNGTPEAALKRIAKGFQFVTISSDARLMAAGAQSVLSRMRAAPSASTSGGY